MRGEVVYLYAFDVADEIALGLVTEILSKKAVPFVVRLSSQIPREQPLYQPLCVEPLVTATIRQQPVRVVVRVYGVGVISVTFRVPWHADQWQELYHLHDPRLDNGDTLDRFARRVCDEVYEGLRPVLIRSSRIVEPEAYTAFCITDLGQETDTVTWFLQNRREIAGLLTQTMPQLLSDEQVQETLRIRRSYEKTDLVVIDWDAALIVDTKGYMEDVLYVLELANLQLEEFRMMDHRLDKYLDRAYDDLERGRWGIMLFQLRRTLSKLRRFRVDVTRIADEVSHITKFLGDWYLARVYLGAKERFHLDHWRQSVEQRLAQLDHLYQIFQSEIYERRMLWMEAAIVLLFIIDLVALFLFRH
ncbi:MAG: hypothetical protein RMJ19_02390 [Gemmatales bacterium]|nr:hypothetical protein [Gemmatales bacterium]MCS7159296.1 hypothetical protein [Gemmatales bacterium]MDW8174496.1 hypothetical protein [Gemmatales bacterium]MDW8223712.1 hypothetical protein [Gemmatales bacterium]